jgi:hypothetical protein
MVRYSRLAEASDAERGIEFNRKFCALSIVRERLSAHQRLLIYCHTYGSTSWPCLKMLHVREAGRSLQGKLCHK